MSDTLRILMVAHAPWDVRLGGPSVQLRIAEHLRAAGHHVDLLGLHEVAARPPRTKIGQLFAPPFSKAAVPTVRARAGAYDVIDALQGDLPMPRSKLGFAGALVTRSPGLVPAYRRFLDSIPDRWPDAPRPNRWARPIRQRQARLETENALASFLASDLILVPNDAEGEELAQMGFGDVTRVVPNGIPDALLDDAARRGPPDPERAASREVAVIATWDIRKGRLDWPYIIDVTRQRVPEATFAFLGTGLPAPQVLDDLGRLAGVRVVPSYDPATLPDLLAGAKTGALASYVEGFGLGLVEQMACGLPTVAYDVAGPRHTVGGLDPRLLVPAGNITAFAVELSRMLLLPNPAYERLATRARERAGRYRYSAVTSETLAAYRDALTTIAAR